MIEYIKKDITTVTHGIVAHGCNTGGVMGAGIALAIKNKWPLAYTKYVERCQQITDSTLLGHVQIVEVVSNSTSIVYVANLFTQDWSPQSTYTFAQPEAIRTCLTNLFIVAQRISPFPVYMPKIGCGLGRLNWEQDVESMVSELHDSMGDKLQLYICDI